MINNVVLVGRLANDPELTYTPSGTAVAKFRLAVNRPPRQGSDQQETDWLNVVTFGRTAETCAQYLNKGALVGIEGRVQSSTWERQDGTRGYSVEINALRVQFLESRRDREAREAGGGERPRQPAQRPAAAEPSAPPPQETPDIDWALDEEEDPFGDQ